MVIGIALKYEDVRADDYEVINAYAGTDKRWHSIMCVNENVRGIISFSRIVISCALISAIYESRGEA